MNISNFIEELKRRNVFKVATAYAIAGWLIIQVIDTISPQLGFPDWIPPFFTVSVLIGFPLAVIFAWAFELTPEGLKKSKEVEITESVTRSTGKKINGVIITVLSMAVIFLLVERVFFAEASFIENQTAAIETASIAVLPFVNMSGDQDNEYFSDGLSEELLNGLAKLEDIQVAGRTSSFQFKGQNLDLRDVGNQLGVMHVLEGSVRKSGNRVRITAQLIQADNGFHLWSETYDRELTANDIFDIQEEITRQVVAELKVRLLPEEELIIDDRPTQDIEAYNAFLEATQLEADRKAEDIEKAIAKYNDAIRIDPTFALAYSRLAYAYALLYSYGDLSLEEAKFSVRKNVDQALLLDENQGKAYQALAIYYMDYEADYDEAEEAAKKAVEIAPNDPFSHNVLANALWTNRKRDESRESVKRAYELDPLNQIIATNYADDLASLEKYEESLKILDEVLTRNPDYSPALINKVEILQGGPYGQIDEAYKLLFSYYQKDRTDLQSIYELYQLSRTLGMMSLMEFFQSEMETYYPNNTALLNMEGWTDADKGDYAKSEKEFFEYIDEYGDSFKEFAIGYMNEVYYNQQKYQEWVDLVDEFHPEFSAEEPEIEPQNAIRLLNYSSYLQILGEKERAAKLQSVAIIVMQDRIKEFEEEGREMPALFFQGLIDIHTKNEQAVLEFGEILYFEKKAKDRGFYFLLKNHFLKDLLSGEPEYEALKERINEDLAFMRDNVIEYLKAEGEWKEEWEVSK